MRSSARRATILGAVLFLVVGALTAVPSLAEDSTEEGHGEKKATHKESHADRNHFMGIVGWSHKDTDKDAFTFGMEYTRMFTPNIGVAAYIEFTEGQFEADTAGLALVGYPTKRLSLFAGPGIERSLFEEKAYLARVGLGYTFHPRGVVVEPLAWVDFVDGRKIYFLGVGVGKHF